jgi:DNA-binding LacI/PurR family transcriptional regulator
VSPETVERVKKYAEHVNYIPNRLARNLTKPGLPPVGLIISEDSSSEKSLHAMRRAMRMLDENGRDFIVQNFLKFRISDAIYAMKGMNVKQIVMFGAFYESINVERSPKDIIARFRTDQSRLLTLLQDIQFYAVDYNFPVPEDSQLKIWRLGIRRSDIYTSLFTELFKAGKVPVVCDENCVSSPSTMRNLADSGFEIKPEHIIIMTDFPSEDLFAVGASIVPQVIAMIKADRIKTVVLHDDSVAAGLIDGLLKNGYAVPGDVSVVGFNNIAAAQYFRVPLTTIGLPVMENTVMVIESILSGKAIPRTIESDAKIFWRESAKI